MTHGSLFSGIGGFDLAAAWAGWTNAFNCEIDPFCRKILKYHFPDAVQYEDIHTTDFTVWRDRIDVLTGGFPCQPFSLAGKRKGTEDDRYLWPAMLGAIRTVRPRWVVGENVYGIVNWSKGVVFEQVCADLEAAGYEVQPYIIPACGVDAPHRRDRVWFVAHRTDAGAEAVRERSDGIHADGAAADTDCNRQRIGTNQQITLDGSCGTSDACVGCKDGSAADPQSERLPQRYTQPFRNETYPAAQRHNGIPDWKDFPSQPPVRGRDDGFSDRLDGITFPAWCRESIKGFGNAIVPQVAFQILETINVYNKLTK